MNKTRLVSIITTVYNAEKYLSQAIESVLNQSYTHFEYIIVNDGSKDQTQEIIDQYSKKDARIKVLQAPKNQGVGLSSNLGLEIAEGEYIARFDADDIMFPNRIEEQVQYLEEHPDISMTSCHAYYINSIGKTVGIQKYKGYENKEAFHQSFKAQVQVRCSHSGFFCRTKDLRAIGGYRDLRVGADVDMFTRMAEAGYVLVVQDKVLIKFRMHATSIMGKTNYETLVFRAWIADSAARRQSNRPEIRFEEYQAILDKESTWNKLSRRRVAYAFHYYKVATTAYANRQFLVAFYYSFIAIIMEPSILMKKVIPQFKNLATLKRRKKNPQQTNIQ